VAAAGRALTVRALIDEDEPVHPEDSARMRDLLASNRTLLAWVRTAISFAGLGFVVARFGLFLDAQQSLKTQAHMAPNTDLVCRDTSGSSWSWSPCCSPSSATPSTAQQCARNNRGQTHPSHPSGRLS
jgi:hypothetical protein